MSKPAKIPEFCVDKNLTSFTEAELEEFAKYAGNVQSTNPQPVKSSEVSDVLEVITAYRDVYEHLEDNTQTTDELPESTSEYAKQMQLVELLTKAHMHIGSPVSEAPFFENEDEEVYLIISIKLMKEMGSICTLSVYLLDTYDHSKGTEQRESFSTDISEAYLSVPLKSLEVWARYKQRPCIQLLVELKYEGTDAGPSPSFLKRIEVWTKENGFFFSKKSSAWAWPIAMDSISVDRVQRRHTLNNFLHKPPSHNSTQKFEFEIFKQSEDPTVCQDWDSQLDATFLGGTGLAVEHNWPVATTMAATFGKRLLDIENIFACTRIIYRFSFDTAFGNIICIVCGKTFDKLPSLVYHINRLYEKLHIKLQLQDKKTCIIHLEVSDMESETHVGRCNKLMPKNQQVDRKNEFAVAMFSALSASNFQLPAAEFRKRIKDTYPTLQGKWFMCHECCITPYDYKKYAEEVFEVHKIATMWEADFDKKFFWITFKSFLAKSYVSGIRSHGLYQLLDIFILCHIPLFALNRFNFVGNFNQLIVSDIQQVFPAEEKLPPIVALILRNKAKKTFFKLDQEDGDIILRTLWNKKEYMNRTEKEFDVIKKFIGSPFPTTREQICATWQMFASEPDACKLPEVGIFLTTWRDKDNHPVRVPKCLYFGSVADETIQKVFDDFYKI
ncbi:unnamed protein product [Caenorhabditis sp. 36 PRJEB53466]|nr:unnamed protein product [Caenorhabditis sp. 36 PRJEB53466]